MPANHSLLGMLGIERHNRSNLGQVIAGMDAAGCSDTQKRNVLGEDLRLFPGA